MGNVAPTASKKTTVMAIIVLVKNISMYFTFSMGLFIDCKNMISEKTMLYANLPGIMGNNAGI